MPQSLSSLLVHLIFSTKDRCPFLGKSDLLQHTHAYLGGILRRVQCPAITIGGAAGHVHAFFQSDIASQAEHHQKISFQEELREILRKYGVAFGERYLWD